MNFDAPIALTRNVDAIAIPAGTPIPLAEGQEVRVTQELGGNYTVLVEGMMARIDGKDADSLGLAAAKADAPRLAKDEAAGPLSEEKIYDVMRQCYDPEIPVNIVDLGLIYDCALIDDEGGKKVDVKMTLTAPGCGMGQIIADDVKARVLELPEVTAADIEIVWEPQWNQSMMTEAARLQLGLM